MVEGCSTSKIDGVGKVQVVISKILTEKFGNTSN